jgi:hypothetical protein
MTFWVSGITSTGAPNSKMHAVSPAEPCRPFVAYMVHRRDQEGKGGIKNQTGGPYASEYVLG